MPDGDFPESLFVPRVGAAKLGRWVYYSEKWKVVEVVYCSVVMGWNDWEF